MIKSVTLQTLSGGVLFGSLCFDVRLSEEEPNFQIIDATTAINEAYKQYNLKNKIIKINSFSDNESKHMDFLDPFQRVLRDQDFFIIYEGSGLNIPPINSNYVITHIDTSTWHMFMANEIILEADKTEAEPNLLNTHLSSRTKLYVKTSNLKNCMNFIRKFKYEWSIYLPCRSTIQIPILYKEN